MVLLTIPGAPMTPVIMVSLIVQHVYIQTRARAREHVAHVHTKTPEKHTTCAVRRRESFVCIGNDIDFARFSRYGVVPGCKLFCNDL